MHFYKRGFCFGSALFFCCPKAAKDASLRNRLNCLKLFFRYPVSVFRLDKIMIASKPASFRTIMDRYKL